MPFDWKQHLRDILSTTATHTPRTPHVPPGGVPEGFDAIKGHRVDFAHADKVDYVAGMLNAVKTTYHANGKSDMKMGHGHDPHLMTQDLAANIMGEQGIVPKYANGGRHKLHAVDTTPDGTGLRLHYASNDPMEPGHVFSLRGDGTLRYHGRSNHRNAGHYTSPFGLKDKQPQHD